MYYVYTQHLNIPLRFSKSTFRKQNSLKYSSISFYCCFVVIAIEVDTAKFLFFPLSAIIFTMVSVKWSQWLNIFTQHVLHIRYTTHFHSKKNVRKVIKFFCVSPAKEMKCLKLNSRQCFSLYTVSVNRFSNKRHLKPIIDGNYFVFSVILSLYCLSSLVTNFRTSSFLNDVLMIWSLRHFPYASIRNMHIWFEYIMRVVYGMLRA